MLHIKFSILIHFTQHCVVFPHISKKKNHRKSNFSVLFHPVDIP